MREISNKWDQLKGAMEEFAECLNRMADHSREMQADRLNQEQTLINEICALTSQGCFHRAFSEAELEKLREQLGQASLEIGRCAGQLTQARDFIAEKLERQRQADSRFLTSIQSSLPPQEYQKYHDLFTSEPFLSYLAK